MIGIYLLVNIFAQLSPFTAWIDTVSGPTQIEVSFDRLNGIKLGAPVLANGQLVGKVTKIIAEDEDADAVQVKDAKDHKSFSVEVTMAARHRSALKDGTVALIAAPLSVSRNKPEAVLELFRPLKDTATPLKVGSKIPGFASFEEFWAGRSSNS